MQIALLALILLVPCTRCMGQGTPPPVPLPPPHHDVTGTPPLPPAPTPKPKMQQRVKTMVENQVQKAIDQSYPPVQEWQPITAGQKFHVYLRHSISPRTFIAAAVDASVSKWQSDNQDYARGIAGYAQHYGIGLAKEQSDTFFQSFLIPVLLKQDPRYFRNPRLPFFKRALYSVSRVVITRNDRGDQTFNSSYVVGGAVSQALFDIYAPGHRQGLQPLIDRLTYNLALDGGLNLLQEFWPDLRRKFLHR
jgi:hypothetical protein